MPSLPTFGPFLFSVPLHPKSGKNDTKSEKAQQQPCYLLPTAWLHRTPNRYCKGRENNQRNPHPTVGRRTKIQSRTPTKKMVHRGGFEPP